MRVVFRHRRLPKPRGAWRYGLEIEVRLECTPAEAFHLRPEWEASVDVSRTIVAYEDPMRQFDTDPPMGRFHAIRDAYLRVGSRTLQRHDNGFVAIWPKATWPKLPQPLYFQRSEDREAFITVGRALARQLVVEGQKFLALNPAVPGDVETIEEITDVRRTSEGGGK